jgi:hypothetical protein
MPSQTERASGCWSARGSLDVGPCGRGWRLFSPAAWAGAVHQNRLLSAESNEGKSDFPSERVCGRAGRSSRDARVHPARTCPSRHSPPLAATPLLHPTCAKQEPTCMCFRSPSCSPDAQCLTGRWSGLRSGRRWWRRGWAPQLSWATYTSPTGSHSHRLSARPPSADPPGARPPWQCAVSGGG